MCDDVVEHSQHLLRVLDFMAAVQIGSLFLGLVPHRLKEHVDALVGFDEMLKFLYHWVQFVLGLVGFFDQVRQPCRADFLGCLSGWPVL